MKLRYASFVLLILIPFLVVKAQPPATSKPPQIVAPGGAWWKPATRVTIDAPVTLTRATRLEADEIVINAPLVTNGETLDLFARRLVFGEKGEIKGFAGPASEGIPAPPYETPAASGTPHGNPGAAGASGRDGNPGVDGKGANGPWPGEISLFAGEVLGEPVVDGTGQTGGKGGRGGAGQKGGTGGPGRNADAHIIGSNTHATDGGPGGAYGKGGKGGRGGKGGVPVPVTLLAAWNFNRDPQYRRVATRPGAGGAPGEAGAPGAPGDGGPGGAGDVAEFLFFTSTEDPGNPGPAGAACPNPADKAACTLGDGAAGAPGDTPTPDQLQAKLKRGTPLLVRTFPDFETKRFALSLAWYEFHWWRYFELLADGSLPLVLEATAPAPIPGGQPSLDDLLKGRIRKKNLELVQSKWDTLFLRPLRRAAKEYEADARVTARLGVILPLADRYHAALGRVLARGGVSAEDATELRRVLDRIREARRFAVKGAGESCKRYATEVLQSSTYRELLQGRQTYYDVPACLEIASFTEDGEGVLKPIELARELPIVVEPAIAAGVKIETLVPAEVTGRTTGALFRRLPSLLDLLVPAALAGDLPEAASVVVLSPRKLKLAQIREFYPRASEPVPVAGFGVHKGFVLPRRSTVTMETLGEYLYSLAVTVGGNPK